MIVEFGAEKPSLGITLCSRYNQTPVSSVQAWGKIEPNWVITESMTKDVNDLQTEDWLGDELTS
jgi:hypothetical protein